MDVTVLPGALSGDVTVPPSKSAAHRAILAAALADGESRIDNVDLSSDIRATIGACRSLGCEITVEERPHRYTLAVRGGLRGVLSPIDCAESGSTLRFFIPVACTLDGEKTFTGRGRLPHRPLDAYLQIFDRQGIAYTHPSGTNLPLTVSGRLRGGDYLVDGRVSSQFVTGLLYALPLLEQDSTITVLGGFESRGYVDLTVDILRRFGVEVDAVQDRFTVRGGQRFIPRTDAVEGDYSQAAFFIVAGAIAGGTVRIAGLGAPSLQPDSVIVPLMRQMGARITQSGDVLTVEKSALHGIDIDVSQCPDLVPPLAIAAACAQGETRITGAARLRIKESDRLHALADNLCRLGVNVHEAPDALIIRGGRISGGTIDTYGDHRIAMAFAVAATAAEGAVTIPHAECADKSYPAFYEDFGRLGGKIV